MLLTMGAQKRQKDTHMVIAVAFFNVNMFCVCVTAVRHLFEVEIWGLYSILGVFQSDAIFKPQEGQTHLIEILGFLIEPTKDMQNYCLLVLKIKKKHIFNKLY